MGRDYSVNGNATNTASATLPIFTLISTANIRPEIYEMVFGTGAAPANNQMRMVIQRCTTAGTPGSAITPRAIDPGVTTAAQATVGVAIFSVGPTLTALEYLRTIPVNMQSTYRVVLKDGKEIKLPNTAANGVAFISLAVNSAWDLSFGCEYSE